MKIFAFVFLAYVILAVQVASAVPEEMEESEVTQEQDQEEHEKVFQRIRAASDVALEALRNGEITKGQFQQIINKLKERIEKELGYGKLGLGNEEPSEEELENARKQAIIAFKNGQISQEDFKEIIQGLAPRKRAENNE